MNETFTMQIHKQSGATYILRWEEGRITGHNHNYPAIPSNWWIHTEMAHPERRFFHDSERELAWANNQEWSEPLEPTHPTWKPGDRVFLISGKKHDNGRVDSFVADSELTVVIRDHDRTSCMTGPSWVFGRSTSTQEDQ